MGVQIVTGRKHQIRVHLSSSGYPVVCDWRYGREHISSDLEWCSRNFLHRYRLAFEDLAGVKQVVVEPLTPDLRDALRALVPADVDSATVAAEWIKSPQAFR